MADWSRVVNTTIKQYIRGEENNILRNRKLSALIQKRGRIVYNRGGTEMDWKVRFKRATMIGYQDGDSLTFARNDRHKTAKLGWRGYSATDSISKGEFLKNRGKEAIINLFSNLASDLKDDVEDAWGEEFYTDGDAAGNEKKMHGIESFMGYSAAVAANGNCTPNDTFANLSCVPGNYGGTWTSGAGTGAWPNGKGSPQYDFWSPLIVDYGNALFSNTATWAANAIDAIAYGIIKSKKNKSLRGMQDLILIEEELYRQYIGLLRAKERITINRAADSSELVALGFKDVSNQDGVDITYEYGMPTGVGYGFNLDQMELQSQQAQIFVPDGPDWDIATKTWRISIDFFGNIRWNPKFFSKYVKGT